MNLHNDLDNNELKIKLWILKIEWSFCDDVTDKIRKNHNYNVISCYKLYKNNRNLKIKVQIIKEIKYKLKNAAIINEYYTNNYFICHTHTLIPYNMNDFIKER